MTVAHLTRADIINTIQTNLGEIIDEPDLKLDEGTVSEDVADWDSINHMKLIISLESMLGVRFEPDEIASADNVGELVDLILKKRA